MRAELSTLRTDINSKCAGVKEARVRMCVLFGTELAAAGGGREGLRQRISDFLLEDD
jgi:hypothetical protein